MTKTKYYDLQMDDPQDDYDVEVVNANLKKIDEQMKTRENATDALQEPEFTEAKERKNLTSGEKIHLMLGKISRFFSDMKAIAFSGSYNDLVDKPKIPTVLNNQTTTEEGYALDARQANPNLDGTLAKQVADLNGSLIKVVTKTFALKVDPYGINNWYYMDFDLRNDIDVRKYTLISAYNAYSPSMGGAHVIAFSYIDGLVIRLIFASKLPDGNASFNFIFALAN